MDPNCTVTTGTSDTDGATVVDISTPAGGGQLRVYVNEGVVFDQSPEEHGPHGQCGHMWRDDEPHRCTIVGPHRQHRCGGCRRTTVLP